MRRRLLVLVVAAVVAAVQLGQARAAPDPAGVSGDPPVVSVVDGGWWDWDKGNI
jgi:hypothetical protein